MRAARVELAAVGELEPDVAAGHKALELGRGALRDQPAVVEDRDPVGESIRLLEVLGGQEDRDADGDEIPDDVPHHAAAARIEPGGRLVKEDDPGVADERHREVEPTPHPAGLGRHRLRGRLDEVELLEQLLDAPRPRACRGAAGRPSAGGSPHR